MKEEILKYLEKNNMDDEKVKKLNRDIQDIHKRMETFLDIEKRVNKVFRDADINNLVRQVREKAQTDDVQRDFAIQETKISSLGEQIGYIKKDIDGLLSL